jgi:hypothetical protein
VLASLLPPEIDSLLASIHWGWFGIGLSAALFVVVFLIARRGWNPIALFVAFGNWLIASFNAAAPFRGVIDPDYVGFSFGLLAAERGWPVAIMAGCLLVGGSLAAIFAARQARGRAMGFVALFDTLLLLVAGAPFALSAWSDWGSFVIQFGEYVTIPPLLAIPIVFGLIFGPLVLGVVWGLLRIRR